MRAPREKIISNMPDSKVAIRVVGLILYSYLIDTQKVNSSLFYRYRTRSKQTQVSDSLMVSVSDEVTVNIIDLVCNIFDLALI